MASVGQAGRLHLLIQAKREHDEALQIIEQCVAAGALTASEADVQRAEASAQLQRAKSIISIEEEGGRATAGRALPGAPPPRSESAPRDVLGSRSKEATEATAPRRGRQTGSKNTPRTRIDDLSEETLKAVTSDLGQTWSSDRGQVISGIHAASGASSKVPKTNLEPLTHETLERICADRQLEPVGNHRADVIECILQGAGRKTKAGPAKKTRGAKTPKKREQKPKRARVATAYNLFMKDEVARLKLADPTLEHKTAFKMAAGNWAADRLRKQLPAARDAAGSETSSDKDLEVLEQIKCSICLGTLHNCVSLVPCHHNFCAGCYSDWMQESDACPQCRCSVDDVSRNHTLHNMIQTFLEAHPHLKRDPEDLKELDSRDKLPPEALRAGKRKRLQQEKLDSESEEEDAREEEEEGEEEEGGGGEEEDEDEDEVAVIDSPLSGRSFCSDNDEEEEEIEEESRKAGLALPVSVIRKMILELGTELGGLKLAQNDAVIYLTAVLNYIAAEVIEVSGMLATHHITPQQLKAAVRDDEELLELFSGLHVGKQCLESTTDEPELDESLHKTGLHTELAAGIFFVHKQVNPDLDAFKGRAGRATRDRIAKLLADICARLVELMMSARDTTVSAIDVEQGTERLLPGELAKHAVNEGRKACAKANPAPLESVRTFAAKANGQNCDWSDDDFDRFIETIKSHVHTQDVVEEGVGVLQTYVTGKRGERGQVRRSQVARGALPLVMTIFDRYHDGSSDGHGILQMRLCGILAALTTDGSSDDNRIAIMEAGGIGHIVRHVEAFQGKPTFTLQSAMSALAGLCKHYECATRVVRLDGIKLLLRAKSQVKSRGKYEHMSYVEALSALCEHDKLVDGVVTAGRIDAFSADAVKQLLKMADVKPEQREAIQRLLPAGSSS